MHLRLVRTACCAVGLLVGIPAFAQPAALSSGDQQFVNAAAIGGQFEVAAGKLAARSADGRVKAFGERMVKDHSAAGAQLARLVKAQGGTVPQGLDAEHQQERDQLAALKGEDFDRAYISMMVKDHDADTKAFSDEERSATDPRLKQFVEQTLTMVKEHDQLARQIAGTLGVNSGPNPAKS